MLLVPNEKDLLEVPAQVGQEPQQELGQDLLEDPAQVGQDHVHDVSFVRVEGRVLVEVPAQVGQDDVSLALVEGVLPPKVPQQ